MNNWFLSSFNSLLFGQLAKTAIGFENTKQWGMSLYRSLCKILCIKPVIAILLFPDFSALADLQFCGTSCSITTSHAFPSFLCSHLCGSYVTCCHFLHLSVSLFRMCGSPVTVRALQWQFIYALPTLFALPYCLTDVGSLGKRASSVRTVSPLFQEKTLL